MPMMSQMKKNIPEYFQYFPEYFVRKYLKGVMKNNI